MADEAKKKMANWLPIFPLLFPQWQIIARRRQSFCWRVFFGGKGYFVLKEITVNPASPAFN